MDEAEAAASRLLEAVAVRNQASKSDAAKMRQRAFTLMSNFYDDARRMVTYLRWKQGDADRIAPSFYAGRTTRRRRKHRESEEVVTDPSLA